MTATAADYVWLNERFPDLAEASCFTLVHNLAPVDVLARLQGQSEPSQTGVEAIVDAAFELLDRSDNTRQFFAMTTVGDWTLLIEPVGYIGVTEERALPRICGHPLGLALRQHQRPRLVPVGSGQGRSPDVRARCARPPLGNNP